MNLCRICYPTFLLICEVYIEGHQLKTVFSNNEGRRANKPLEIAHSYVFGHIRDVVLINDSMSIGIDLDRCPNGRNEALMVGSYNLPNHYFFGPW